MSLAFLSYFFGRFSLISRENSREAVGIVERAEAWDWDKECPELGFAANHLYDLDPVAKPMGASVSSATK